MRNKSQELKNKIDFAKKDSAIRLVLNHKKGFTGESRVAKLIKSAGVKYFSNLNLEKDGKKVEIDGIFVKGDTIYTVEVKDFSADSIVYENTGSLYRVDNGIKTTLDTISQIDNHKRFIKQNFGANFKIVNILAISSEETPVINNSNDKTLVLLHASYLPRFIDNLSDNTPGFEMQVEKKIEELMSTEAVFKFIDIQKYITLMDEVIEHEHALYYEIQRLKALSKDELSTLEKESIASELSYALGIDKSSSLINKLVTNSSTSNFNSLREIK